MTNFSRSTDDVLTVIAEGVYQTSDKNDEARDVALDIPKAYDRVWRAVPLHKLKVYRILDDYLI